ncbi:MAG TPA: tetratricopeptide repeat protein [Polyangia bacterium]|nr:tetratricopeptide repeat protein [Polyangia bacterium]
MRGSLVALLLVCLGARALAAPPAAPAQADHVHDLLEEWRVTEAAAEADKLAASDPEDPATLLAVGDVRFQQGDYKGALERFDRALVGLPRGAGEEWRALRELIASTAAATRDFKEATSPDGHFIIRYGGRDEILLPYAFAALAAARREIAERDFGGMAAFDAPVRVEIYSEIADLARVSTLTLKEIETSGTIALCKWNRLMIVSPRALVRGYPWLDTLAHEFTHFVVSRASHNTVPIWLHEGLAKFEERRWREAPGGTLSPTMEHLLATALGRSGRLITFEEMHPSMAKLPSQADTALAFAEVASVIEYLQGRHGWEGIRQVILYLKSGSSDARAIAAVTNRSFSEFQSDWKSWLRGRKLRTHPGLVPASLKFARRGKGQAAERDREKDEDDTQEITEERARRFARLGGMLETHGRLAPAAFEYEKAQGLTGPGNLPVANRLARTYLALGDAERAIAAATPASELYPDSAGLSVTLGEAWRRKGQAENAIRYLETALRVNPFDPAPHCALAQLYDAKDERRAREERACGTLHGAPGK